MPLIVWKDSYSVGQEAVDHEHREMIDLINRLHDNLTSGRNPDVSAFLGEIFRVTSSHFALEERFMRNHHYDEYESHKEAHEELLEDIRDIMDGYEADPENATKKLSQQLDRWFTDHFSTHDARLHNQLGSHDHDDDDHHHP